MPFLWRQTSLLRDGSVRWMARCDSLAIPNANSGRIFCYFRFQPHRPGGYLGGVLMLFFSPPVGPNAGGKCDSGAMAAHDLPKVEVGGSSPLYRSTHSSSGYSYNDLLFSPLIRDGLEGMQGEPRCGSAREGFDSPTLLKPRRWRRG